MKIKYLLMVVLALAAMSTVKADVLFEDNFDSYETLPAELLSWGFANLADVAPTLWISPFASVPSSEIKVGPGQPGWAYFSGNNAMDTELRLYEAQIANQWGSDYTVSAEYYKVDDRNTDDSDADGYPDYEDYIPYIYVAGRIAGTEYVIGGIALGDIKANGKRDVYARIRDSQGGTNGDTWVAENDPNAPVQMDLNLSGDTATLTVSHVGLTTVVSLTTPVLNQGAAGFGGHRPWGGYAKAYFDNFIVTGIPFVLPLEGDINGDDVVNFEDLAEIAIDWATCSNPADSACDQYWK